MNDNQTPNRNLNYLFYFLFRTQWWQKNGEQTHEPLDKFDKLENRGIQVDHDKRLFRRSIQEQTPLSHWQDHLVKAWQNILEKYSQAFSPNHPQQGVEDALRYCKDNLLGVAVLILDESLQRHHNTIALDLYDNQSRIGKLCFSIDEKTLFNIRDTSAVMSQDATFHRFRPTLEERVRKPANWSLRLDKQSPYLLQIQPVSDSHPEFRNNPAFAVYGIAHGNGYTPDGKLQPWVNDFADVFLGSDSNPLKETTALLNSIHARFLINDSVFETIDCEAQNLRLELQSQVIRYFEVKEDILKETPNYALEEALRNMDNLITRSNYMLGRIRQAITTLTINRDSFKHRLVSFANEYPRWQLDGQQPTIMAKYSPLWLKFKSHIDNFNYHVDYLEGKLTQLRGARNHWHSHLSEQRHNLFEHLGNAGHVIIFLIALTETGNLLSQEHPTTISWVLFGLVIVILIGYSFWIGHDYYKDWQKHKKHKSRQQAT
jgi:hypothetical protein